MEIKLNRRLLNNINQPIRLVEFLDDFFLDRAKLQRRFESIKDSMKEVFHRTYKANYSQIDGNIDRTQIVFYKQKSLQRSASLQSKLDDEAVKSLRGISSEVTGNVLEAFELLQTDELLKRYATWAVLQQGGGGLSYLSVDLFLSSFDANKFKCADMMTDDRKAKLEWCSNVLNGMNTYEREICMRYSDSFVKRCKTIEASTCLFDDNNLESLKEGMLNNPEDILLRGCAAVTHRVVESNGESVLYPFVFIPIMRDGKYFQSYLAHAFTHEMTHVAESSILYSDESKVILKVGYSIIEYDLKSGDSTGKYRFFNEVSTEIISKKAQKLLLERDATLIPPKPLEKGGEVSVYSFCERSIEPLYDDNERIMETRVANSTKFIDLFGEEQLQFLDENVGIYNQTHTLSLRFFGDSDLSSTSEIQEISDNIVKTVDSILPRVSSKNM